MKKVQILMSVYHGTKYIDEQLKTIIKQKNIELSVLIRLDGYDDPTKQIIKKYKSNYKYIEYYEGENLGYAKSFWDLLLHANSSCDYYAFCDQDDIWDEDKIISAVKIIEKNKNNNIPQLYTSKVCSVNNNMQIINENAFNTHRKLNVYESFQKSSFPGCVFVFNKQALICLKEYNGFMESHDWAAYSIISVLGEVLYDNNSHIKYRIHSNNTIGKSNFFVTIIKKIKRFFSKSKCTRSKFAMDFYNTYKDKIPEEYIEDIFELAYYKASKDVKKKLLFNKNFKGIIFKVYVLLNKV